MTGARDSGRWKKGQSGNAAGRKPGSGEVARLRASIAKMVPNLVKVLSKRALDGDVAAARLLLERTIAPLKASEEAYPIAIPGDTLTDRGRSVLNAVARGVLAPGQGAALLASLGVIAKLVETDELTRRVEALEAQKTAPARP